MEAEFSVGIRKPCRARDADGTELSVRALQMSGEETTDRIPLIIGVTGHRDPHPAIIERLRQQVISFLRELHSSYEHTPLVILSALADGADRIAADAALELSRDGIDVRIVVPMAMPQRIYEEDFDPHSLSEFRELLGQAWASIELPLHPDVDGEALRRDPTLRDRQYQMLGDFINHHCQLLIGLWDGTPGPRGGTADVMQAKLRRDVPGLSRSIFALIDACPYAT